MISGIDDAEESSSSRLILLSLFISNYAVYPSQLVITVLLVEIAGDFELPLGISAQIRSISLAIALVTAIAVGALTVKYGKKLLLLTGLVARALSALGCGLSMNFNTLILFYMLTGLGVTMVGPMATAW